LVNAFSRSSTVGAAATTAAGIGGVRVVVVAVVANAGVDAFLLAGVPPDVVLAGVRDELVTDAATLLAGVGASADTRALSSSSSSPAPPITVSRARRRSRVCAVSACSCADMAAS
jgi:hypothetical protein